MISGPKVKRSEVVYERKGGNGDPTRGGGTINPEPICTTGMPPYLSGEKPRMALDS